MAPVKFGDIPKTASEVLDDDYQTSGYQLKAKQGTNLSGASVTTALDVWPVTKDGKPESVKTPAKITWKFPKPFGIKGISVDKLEMTKSGDFAAELAISDGLHTVKGLSLSAKSDLKSADKATFGATFTGLADTRVQIDTKAMKPADFTMEITRSIQTLTVGAKLSGKDTTPQIAFRFVSNPIFAAFVASDKLKKYKAYGAFTVQDNLKVAASLEYPSLSFTKGVIYDVAPGLKVKAKFAQDGTISQSTKYTVSKGFTCILGGKYNLKTKSTSFGMQLSIE